MAGGGPSAGRTPADRPTLSMTQPSRRRAAGGPRRLTGASTPFPSTRGRRRRWAAPDVTTTDDLRFAWPARYAAFYILQQTKIYDCSWRRGGGH